MSSADPYQGIADLLWADAGIQAAAPGGIAVLELTELAISPAITYHVVGGSGGLILGPSRQNAGPQRRRIQFDARAWGSEGSAAQAYATRNAIRKVLNGFGGELPNGFIVNSIWLIQEFDIFDSDARDFRAVAEYYALFNFQDS